MVAGSPLSANGIGSTASSTADTTTTPAPKPETVDFCTAVEEGGDVVWVHEVFFAFSRSVGCVGVFFLVGAEDGRGFREGGC
jgi:hypothetical protein